MREFSLVHVSDLHITPDRADKFDSLINVIKKYIEHLPKHHPILLLITGDIVQSPSRKNVNKAKELIEGEAIQQLRLFEKPMIIAGNHDTKGFGVFFRKKEFIDAFNLGMVKEYDYNDLGLQIIGVDSTRGKLARGQFSGQDYQEIFANYYKSKNSLRLFALHHHPLPLVTGEDHKVFGLINDEKFLYLKSPAGFLQVVSECGSQIVLHGHRHVSGLIRYSLPKVLENGDIQWSSIYVISSPSSTGHDSDNAGFNILTFELIDQRQFVTIRRYINTDKTLFTIIEPKGIEIKLDGNYSWDAIDDLKFKFKSFESHGDCNQNDVNCLLQNIFKNNIFQVDPERDDWDEVLSACKLVMYKIARLEVDVDRQESFEQLRKCMDDLVHYFLDVFLISKDNFKKILRKHEENRLNLIPRKKLKNSHLRTLHEKLLILHRELIKCEIEVEKVGDYI